MTDAYVAPTFLALQLDLERVLFGLADRLPGEDPAIIAWGPSELAQAVAHGLLGAKNYVPGGTSARGDSGTVEK